MDYHWNWAIFFEPSPDGEGTYAYMLFLGLLWTLLTAATSWTIALSIGTVVGVLRTLPNRALNVAAIAFIEIFRNIPLIVQLFLWFFVLPEILPTAWGTWIKNLHYGPFYTTVVCLGFFTGARIAELVRTGIETLPRGQKMAGLALGMTLPQLYRYILLPNGFRIIFPPLTTEFLVNVKITSVGLAIGLLELTSRARSVQEFSYQVFEAFAVASVLYVFINITVLAVAGRIERHISLVSH